MPASTTELTQVRLTYQDKIVAAVAADDRIVGLVDYGATSQGRGDAWSDLDLCLFVHDAALPAFQADWRAWVAQFGPLLLAYIGGIGHPWVIYDTLPVPLRVDFNFLPLSDLDTMRAWAYAPVSVAATVLYDGTSGQLSQLAANLVGQSLAPDDVPKLFDQVCGDLWYYLLRTHAKVEREQAWLAAWEYNFIILGNLTALLRIEANAMERLRGAHAIAEIESALTPARLAQLDKCRPAGDLDGVRQALRAAAELGESVCAAIAAREGWPWPALLAKRVRAVLA